MNHTATRYAGLVCVVLAVLSILVAPLNALARMRTDDGRSDFENPLAHWWADPATDAFVTEWMEAWNAHDLDRQVERTRVALRHGVAQGPTGHEQQPAPRRIGERHGSDGGRDGGGGGGFHESTRRVR